MVADGAPIETSPELQLLTNINRYGTDAVMGRPLGYNEILCMNIAEDIISAYNARLKSESWASWAAQNPGLSSVLNESMLIAEEYGWS